MKHLFVIALLLILTSILQGQPFSLDTTFQPDYPFASTLNNNKVGNVNNIYEETDLSIMVVGEFTQPFPTNRERVIRLKEDGELDLSWSPSFVITSYASYIEKINDLYYFNSKTSGIRRTDYYGNFLGNIHIPFDDSFSCDLSTSPYFFSDGTIFVGGGYCKYPNGSNHQRTLNFMRIGSNGYVDSSFHHNSNGPVNGVSYYDSTRLMLFGHQLTEYDSIPVNFLCRIDTSGELDTSFYSSAISEGWTDPLYVQPDGKIIIGGWFKFPGNSPTYSLARLNVNGSLDSSFNNFNSIQGPPFPQPDSPTVLSVCPTTDGGLIIGGAFNTYQGHPRSNIVKTDADGFIDLKYFNGTGIDSANSSSVVNRAGVQNIIRGSNDTYYVMGHFLRFDGTIVKPIIRLLGLSYTTPIDEDIEQGKFIVYPNPASDYATFEWEDIPQKKETELTIFNIEGKRIMRQQFSTPLGNWQWDTQGIPSGLYLYEFRADDNALLAKGKIMVEP